VQALRPARLSKTQGVPLVDATRAQEGSPPPGGDALNPGGSVFRAEVGPFGCRLPRRNKTVRTSVEVVYEELTDRFA